MLNRFPSYHVAIDNEMDGESLEALLGTSQGPDCLKELITKLGVRVKVWQRIKASLIYSQVCRNTFCLYVVW